MTQIPDRFTLEPACYGETVFVRLAGEFDMAAEAQFDETVARLCADASTVVVDLSGLTFVDSSGLRSLLRVWQRARDDGFDLAVVPGNGQVRRTMELAGVDSVLPIVTDRPLDIAREGA
jgi:anti-anti-sigma factor